MSSLCVLIRFGIDHKFLQNSRRQSFLPAIRLLALIKIAGRNISHGNFLTTTSVVVYVVELPLPSSAVMVQVMFFNTSSLTSV